MINLFNKIGIIMMGLVICYNVIQYGFLTTLLWVVIGFCIGVLIIKLKESIRV